ncbi:GIY-YIG nuclease family protein, partial [Rhizobiaceae sp. 2RAB30]
MKGNDRKAAVDAYKERKVVAGIYAVRCGPSGECWVGRAPDLSTMQNRLWFTLRQGNGPWRSLQAAWRSHGPDAFSFEVLERIEGEDIAYLRDGILKDRLTHWTGELKA